METSGREAWIVEFFPAICLTPQEFPELRGVTNTARPSATYTIDLAVSIHLYLDYLPMPTIATGSCWSRWRGAMATKSTYNTTQCGAMVFDSSYRTAFNGL